MTPFIHDAVHRMKMSDVGVSFRAYSSVGLLKVMPLALGVLGMFSAVVESTLAEYKMFRTCAEFCYGSEWRKL